MDDNTLLPFDLPAVARKKVNGAFAMGAASQIPLQRLVVIGTSGIGAISWFATGFANVRKPPMLLKNSLAQPQRAILESRPPICGLFIA